MIDALYLNNAATSFPKPDIVKDAIYQYLSSIPCYASRSGIEIESEDLIYEYRSNIANFLGIADGNDLIFTSGGTEALNLAILGQDYKEKNHVITTAIEHNSVIRPLKQLEYENKILLDIIPCNIYGYISEEVLLSKLTMQTKLVVLNHCSNVTGVMLDLSTLVAKIKQKSSAYILIDASQSVGKEIIDVSKVDIDLLAFTGHKSLYGYPGIGALYIKPDINLKPIKYGGTGIWSDNLYQPIERPLFYESGTPNILGIFSMHKGINYLRDNWSTIKIKEDNLIRNLIQELTAMDFIRICPRGNYKYAPIVSFNVDGLPCEDVGYILEYEKIIIRAGLHCAPLIHQYIGTAPDGCVRVSISEFTTQEEIDFFCSVVKRMKR